MTIEQRMESLEHQNRRLKQGMYVLMLVGLSLLLLGQVTPKSVPDEIKTKRIEVVNDDGRPAVVMSQSKDGGVVAVFNAEGKLLATLNAGKFGAIATFGDKENMVVSLGVTEDGSNGAITTFGERGNPLVKLAATNGSNGAIAAFGGNGKASAILATSTDGSGMIGTLNEKGNVITEIGSTAGGGGSIATYDEKGNRLIVLGTSKEDGEGRVFTYNRAGKVQSMWPTQ